MKYVSLKNVSAESSIIYFEKDTGIHRLLIILFLLICISTNSLAQNEDNNDKDEVWGDWKISFSIGSQMSGMKKEDFVASNFSPLLNVSFGKWFSPSLALEIGYKGWYYNTISDDNKHHYGYYYGATTLNIKALFHGYKETCKWILYLHAGAGYFYNYTYKRPNICADFGVSNNFRLSNNLIASLDVSAITGWDIYQGDEDILPGITIGIHYLF